MGLMFSVHVLRYAIQLQFHTVRIILLFPNLKIFPLFISLFLLINSTCMCNKRKGRKLKNGWIKYFMKIFFLEKSSYFRHLLFITLFSRFCLIQVIFIVKIWRTYYAIFHCIYTYIVLIIAFFVVYLIKIWNDNVQIKWIIDNW